MESAALGNYVLPTMEKLTRKIPTLTAAVLCSTDGFNICSIGIDETGVGKLVALGSSLFAVSRAMVGELDGDSGTRESDQIAIASGDLQIVGIRVRHRTQRPLLLMVAADKAALGAILVNARAIGAELEERFSSEGKPAPPA